MSLGEGMKPPVLCCLWGPAATCDSGYALTVSHFLGDHWIFPLKAESFRKSKSLIRLLNTEPLGMVPSSRTVSVNKTNMVPASWVLKLVWIGEEINKNFTTDCDDCSRGNRQVLC